MTGGDFLPRSLTHPSKAPSIKEANDVMVLSAKLEASRISGGMVGADTLI
jgi:hypothetical protein